VVARVCIYPRLRYKRTRGVDLHSHVVVRNMDELIQQLEDEIVEEEDKIKTRQAKLDNKKYRLRHLKREHAHDSKSLTTVEPASKVNELLERLSLTRPIVQRNIRTYIESNLPKNQLVVAGSNAPRNDVEAIVTYSIHGLPRDMFHHIFEMLKDEPDGAKILVQFCSMSKNVCDDDFWKYQANKWYGANVANASEGRRLFKQNNSMSIWGDLDQVELNDKETVIIIDALIRIDDQDYLCTLSVHEIAIDHKLALGEFGLAGNFSFRKYNIIDGTFFYDENYTVSASMYTDNDAPQFNEIAKEKIGATARKIMYALRNKEVMTQKSSLYKDALLQMVYALQHQKDFQNTTYPLTQARLHYKYEKFRKLPKILYNDLLK
jgi:hypothetical protein